MEMLQELLLLVIVPRRKISGYYETSFFEGIQYAVKRKSNWRYFMQ